VEHDELIVDGAVDIEFDGGGAVGERLAHRRDRVFDEVMRGRVDDRPGARIVAEIRQRKGLMNAAMGNQRE
jgi:hypothetical protein